MVTIHPTAIVDPKASLGDGTTVGPYAIVEGTVVTGKNCQIFNNAVLQGHTTLGDECRVFPFAVIGGEPQHTRYKGEPTTVKIGNKVVMREYVTVQRGMPFATGTTVIGDETLLMAYCHVAHDCVLGKGVIMANSANLAGHTEVQDYVTMGGLSAVAQNCRVGRYCYIGGGSIIRKDLPPFLAGKGDPFDIQGINMVGLERRGFSPPTIQRLRKIYRIFYLRNLTMNAAIDEILREIGETDEAGVFLNFVRASKVGVVR